MAEEIKPSTVPTPAPSTKPDWVVASMLGKIKSPADLSAAGMTTSDFNISSSPKDYWGKESIRKQFNDDEQAFNKFYNNELDRYNKSLKADHEIKNYIPIISTTRQAFKPYVSWSQDVDQSTDIYGRVQLGTELSPKRFGYREGAINRKARLEDGSRIAPKDYKGTLILARDANGDFDLDENGQIYYRPLKEGEEIKTYDDVYDSSSTLWRTAEEWGMYGVETNYLKESAYQLANVIPNFLARSGDSFLEYGRQIEMITTAPGKLLGLDTRKSDLTPKAQSWLRGEVGLTSERAQEDWTDRINLMSMGLDVVMQLSSMGAVSRITGWATKDPRLASLAGRAWMTGISAGNIAQRSREAGLGPIETATLLGLNTLGVWHLSRIDDAIVQGFRPMQFEKYIDDMQPIYGMFEGAKELTPAMKKAYFHRTVSAGKRFIDRTVGAAMSSESELAKTAGSMALEGIQESLEQAWDSSLRLAHDTLSEIAPIDGSFNWDASQEATAMFQATTFGTIGGGIARPLLKAMRMHDRENIKTLEAAVAHNDEGFVFNMIDKWEKAGRFAIDAAENSKKAEVWRKVIKGMVEMREKAGLTNMIASNSKAAGAFADVLVRSSIARDKVRLGQELAVLDTQLKDSSASATPERIEELTLKKQAKQKEIDDYVKGLHVDRYVAEGLYNIHADPTLARPGYYKFSPPESFDGRTFATMNEETIRHKVSLKDVVDKHNKTLADNDLTVNPDNYKQPGYIRNFTEAGRQSLVAQFLERRKMILEKIRTQSDAILTGLRNPKLSPVESAAPEEVLANVFDDANLINTSIKSTASGVLQDEFIDDVKEPWYKDIAALSALDDEIRSVLKQPVAEPRKSVDNDEWFIYDFENNKSTVPLTDRIKENLMAAGVKEDGAITNPDKEALYISNEPTRLLQVVRHRLAQVEGIGVLNGVHQYGIKAPEVTSAEATTNELKGYEQTLLRLKDLSDRNASNTDAQVKKAYMEKLKVEFENVKKAAINLTVKFPEVTDLIDNKYVYPLQKALDEGDSAEYYRVYANMATELNSRFAEKADAILSALEVKSENPAEYSIHKPAYEFMRRVLRSPIKNALSALLDFVNNTPVSDKSIMPSDEQLMVIRDAIMNVFAGEYAWSPRQQSYGTGRAMTYHSLSFQSAIDGSSGTGKTRVVVPGLAFAVNEMTGQKVIVTAAKDRENAKRTKIQSDIEEYFGKKPDYIKYSEKEKLIDILESNEINDVSLIVFDEAGLIPLLELRKINIKLNAINAQRIKDGGKVKPLHIIYTYDKYQNAHHAAGDLKSNGISSNTIYIPTTPRLSFSYRSVNMPLKSLEDNLRMSQVTGKEPELKVYENDGKGNGVTIVTSKTELNQEIIKLAEREKAAKGNLKGIAYIKANEKTTTAQSVADLGLYNTTSLDSQGREWDYVIVDSESGDLFKDQITKQEIYTGATRPRKGVIIYVNPDLGMSSVEGQVKEFVPVRPAAKGKEKLVSELTAIIGGQGNSTYAASGVKAANTSKDRHIIPATNPNDGTDENVEKDLRDKAAVAAIIKAAEHGKGERKYVTLNSFYNVVGTPIEKKKEFLFEAEVRNGASYRLTIAPLTDPRYELDAEVSSRNMEDKYGIFVEAKKAGDSDADWVVIGTLSSESKKPSTTDRLREAGLIDGTNTIMSYPIDKSVLTEAVGYHPFIQNHYTVGTDENGKPMYERTTAVHNLSHVLNEASKKNMGVSPVLFATTEINSKNIFNGEKMDTVRIKAGEPFVALSYRQNSAQLKQLVLQGQLNINHDEIATLVLRREYFSFDEVVEMLSPRLTKLSNNKYYFDPNSETFYSDLAVYESLWSDSQFIHDAYNQAIDLLIADGDQSAIEWAKVERRPKIKVEGRKGKIKTESEAYNPKFLLADVIGGMKETDPAVNKKNNFAFKKRVFETMMATDTFVNGFRYNPRKEIPRGKGSTRGRTGTVSYLPVEPVPREILDKALSASYHELQPPKIQVSTAVIDKLIGGQVAPQGPATQSGSTADGTTTALGTSKIRPTPMNFNEFMNIEFPEEGQLAYDAIQIFKRRVVDSHVNLVVGDGQQPSISELGDTLAPDGKLIRGKAYQLREELRAAIKKEKATVASRVDAALARNYERLLANYFPSIVYNSATDTFSVDNTVYKTETFAEQAEENLLTHGMTSIVKTYLMTTPLDDRTYFGERHLANIIPLFRGLNTTNNEINRISPHDFDQIEAVLRSSDLPEAKALLSRFFSSSPERVGDKKVRYSTRLVESYSGQNLTTAVAAFLIKAEQYIQGYTEIHRSESGDFDDKQISDSRGVNHPTGPFTPTAIGYNFIQGYNKALDAPGGSSVGANDGLIRIGKSTVFDSKKEMTAGETSRMLRAIGLPGADEETVGEYLKKDPAFGNNLRKHLMKSVRALPKSTTVDVHLAKFLNFYADKLQLGSGLSIINMENKRQHVLRTTAPIFHMHDTVAKLRKSPGVHGGNLMLGEKYSFSMSNAPFVNGGVKIIDKNGSRSKPMSKMTDSELLDVFMLDGFLNTALKGEDAVSFPITVYADSGQEVVPLYRNSEQWITDDKDGGAMKVLNALFESRGKKLAALEQNILGVYSQNWEVYNGDLPKDLNDLQAKLKAMPVEARQQLALRIQSSPGAVAGVHYDEKRITVRDLTLKQSLLDDRNLYMDEKRRPEFIEQARRHAEDVVEMAKQPTSGPTTTFQKVEAMAKGGKHSAETLIKVFYANWLAMSSETRDLVNGNKYQYKGEGGEAFIDMVKRSRSLTSPTQLYVLRNSSWAQKVQEFKLANPDKPLPLSLMYEGSKLSRRQKIFQLTDPTLEFRSFFHGGVVSNKVFDGATLVTPFTRIKQDYSSGLTSGAFVGPVMKNVTHYTDATTGTKGFIKNAEFEITPEILRRGDANIRSLFTQMVGETGMQALVNAGMSPDFSNVERSHFVTAFSSLVENGLQDELVDEAIFNSSHKTGARGVNQVYSDPVNKVFNPALTPSYINIEMKGIQQDAMKDPSEGMDIKVLTQLVQAIAYNWVNDPQLKSFYNSLSQITKDFIDNLAAMNPETRRNTFEEIMRRDLLRKDGINYRTDVAAKNMISINDRSMSSLYIQAISSELKERAIAFKLRGGHYVMHPGTFIEIYDVEQTIPVEGVTIVPGDGGVRVMKNNQSLGFFKDAETAQQWIDASAQKIRYTAFRDQLATVKGKVIGGPRQLKYTDAVRESDGKGYLELLRQIPVDENGKIADMAQLKALQASLETENWTVGEAEILLPAEMKNEFFLEDAITQGIPLGEIDENYFYERILTKEEREEATEQVESPSARKRARLVYESFQKRLTGTLTRIPTTGKHSAITVKVIGFMNESMNSVYANPQLLEVQGADQDIDKGSYLTYKTILQYQMIDPDVKGSKPRWTYNPDDLYHRHLVKTGVTRATGIIPTIENIKDILAMRSFARLNKHEKAAIERLALENELVKSIQVVLNDPRSLVETNTSAADVIKPLEKARDKKLGGENAKARYSFDSLLSLLKIHEENQAGGKGIIGIFANGGKAYATLYIMNKLTGQNKLAGLEGKNEIWERIAGFTGASVDNGNLMILGTLRVDETAAPFVSYMLSTGMTNEQIEAYLETNAAFFDEIRQGKRIDRKKGFNIEKSSTVTLELKSLFYKTLEFQVLTQALVNRDLPVRMEDVASYLLSLERFVRISYRNAGIKESFDIEKFMNDAQYRDDQIAIYDRMIAGSSPADPFAEVRIEEVVKGKDKEGYIPFFTDGESLDGRIAFRRYGEPVVVPGFEDVRLMRDAEGHVYELTTGRVIGDGQKPTVKQLIKLFTEKDVRTVIAQQRKVEYNNALVGVPNTGRHQYNILQVFRDVPHMAQYQRSLNAVHQQSKDIKAYRETFEIQRRPLTKKDTAQFYFYDTDTFMEDYDFTHALFIDAYLKKISAETIDLTGFDLGRVSGRQAFIKSMHEGLADIQALNNGRNKILKELTLQEDSRTGETRIVLHDYYDMSEDRKALYMQEMRAMDPNLRAKLFLYNLIVTKEKNSKGVLTSFFSANDKRGYINFLDRFHPNSESMKEAFEARDGNANSEEPVSLQPIPFFASGDTIYRSQGRYTHRGMTPNPKKGEKTDPAVIIYEETKTSFTMQSLPVSVGVDDEGNKVLILDKSVIANDFKNKAWVHGRYMTAKTVIPALPKEMFKSQEEYSKFIREVAYLSLTKQVANLTQAAQVALQRMGKDWNPPRSEKENEEKAEKCGLKVGDSNIDDMPF